MGLGAGQCDSFGVVESDLDDALDRLVSAGAVGQETPGNFGAGELDRSVTGEELSHGDDALLVELTRETNDAANLVGLERGEGEGRRFLGEGGRHGDGAEGRTCSHA